MLRTQSLIGGLNMRKVYAVCYHVEMSEISCVNLQIGLHNDKVQDVCATSWNITKKRRGSGEPIQCAMVRHSSIAIIMTCYLYVSSISQSFLGTVITSYPKKISTYEYKLHVISQPVLFIVF